MAAVTGISTIPLGFSMRVVSVDSYMCEPVTGLDVCRAEFRKNDIKSVPVIRVFGSTLAGQTTCLHVHGVFPYLMIPYCGPDVMEVHWSEMDSYLQQMATRLDAALNSASGKGKSNRQRVFKIVLLRGTPFYGYHEEEELFLKIYFCLPGDIKRAAEMLQTGVVMDRQFQPHEAHVPYILQLFLDYNLYGMNLLHAKNCWFRRPIGKPDAVEELPRIERPDDIRPEEGMGQNEQTRAANNDKRLKKSGDLHIPTISQLRDFNWNLLRERAQSTYSQTHRNQAEIENTEDFDLPQTSSNFQRSSKDEDSNSSSTTQPFSCSDLCKSLLSKTLSLSDSKEVLTGVPSLSYTLCPLHTQWSGQNVPADSKLPLDIGRQSTCDLELDVLAADISNRDELIGASTTNPGIASIWEDERARRRERNEDSQIAMDQSQPRITDRKLPDGEARHIQMLYDALDRYKEEDSLASFNDSESFASRTSTKPSSLDTVRMRHDSKDMFASSGETNSMKHEDEVLQTPSSATMTPLDDTSTGGNEAGYTQDNFCSRDEDVSTLELMRKLQEEEATVATQRGNGPFDGDNECDTPEAVARSQNLLRKQLSFSSSNSQLIASPGPFSGDTQPIAPPSDDEDVIEDFEMSQRWDSAIQDLLQDLSDTDTQEVKDEDEDFIPQIDGASDCSTKVKAAASSKRLGATRRSRASLKIQVQKKDKIKRNIEPKISQNVRKSKNYALSTGRSTNVVKNIDVLDVKFDISGEDHEVSLETNFPGTERDKKAPEPIVGCSNDLTRPSGMRSLKVELWKIPATRRVTLTPEVLHELYSPAKENLRNPRTRPAIPPPTNPMARICRPSDLRPVGPGLAESLVSPIAGPTSTVINYSKPTPCPVIGSLRDNLGAIPAPTVLEDSPLFSVGHNFVAETSAAKSVPKCVGTEQLSLHTKMDKASTSLYPTFSTCPSVRQPSAFFCGELTAAPVHGTEAEGISMRKEKSSENGRTVLPTWRNGCSLPAEILKVSFEKEKHQNRVKRSSTAEKVFSEKKKIPESTVDELDSFVTSFMFTSEADDSYDPFPPRSALLEIGYPSPLPATLGTSAGTPEPRSPMLSQATAYEATTACDLQREFEEPLFAEPSTERMEPVRAKDVATRHLNDISVDETTPLQEIQGCLVSTLFHNGLQYDGQTPFDTTDKMNLPESTVYSAGSGVSCAGLGTDSKEKCAGKESRNTQQKLAASKDAKHTNQEIKSSSTDEQCSADPPSPSDEKSPSAHLPRGIGQAAFIYRTVGQPPTLKEVLSDLKTIGLETNSTSKEPFYRKASDAQATSHRLSNLPPYIKRPKPLKVLRDIPEHHSDLPLEGGLHHWTVLATASHNYSESENAVMREKASKILPPQEGVWDHIDAATKLPQFPSLAKIFLGPKELILRPALQPPSRKIVTEWLESKRKDKILDKSRKIESLLKNVKSSHTPPVSFMPTPRTGHRSISLSAPPMVTPKPHIPRRVSFDLSNLPSDADDDPSPRSTQKQRGEKRSRDVQRSVSKCSKLDPVEGSPVKSCATKLVMTSAQGERSPLCSKLSFAELASPITSADEPNSFLDSTTCFTVSPAQNSAIPDGDSSAIKCLVGSLDKDETSPLTFFISGSFTPPPCSQNLVSKGEDLPSSLKKLPQSTPNVLEQRKKTPALRKLALTPIAGAVTSQAVTPVSATPPTPKQLQQTPSKPTCLRKTLLAQKFHPGDISKNMDPSLTPALQPPPKTDPALSPVVLETPVVGKRKEGSQIDGPTLDNTYGFKAAKQHLGDAKSLHVIQHITSVSMELHVKTRIDLKPDPDMDEIRCLFYCLDCDSWTSGEQGMRTGAIVVDPSSVSEGASSHSDQQFTSSKVDPIVERELLKKSGITHLEVLYVRTELELFLIFAQLMHRWDPDFLVGYEVQMLSWGFLLQRAAHLRCDLCRAISRVPTDDQRNRHDAAKDEYGADNASELHIVGRIVLNLWRLMRTEVALYDYSFESVAYHLLHERHPKYDHQVLTNWFDQPSRSGQASHIQRWRVIDYYVSRVRGSMRLLAQQDFIGRTSELARIFGIQFYDVLTRGSQFRVESMLLRGSRARNLVAVTPSVLQRAQMRAPEVIALVMEPESKFYHVPVLVLDFQSLYPSMVIAYNICYSTCLGRVELLGSDGFFTFGCNSLRVPAKTLNKLLRKNLITINPSGVAFVKPKVRKGVMPQMLDEILTTRIMVKNSMKKLGPDDTGTRRMLDHRQLGLKLIANVTYGYTAANFSGRMPCVEVGDSIVHKARETLERAIRLVTRDSEKWENARVVYGDTDSMFIALEGPNNCGCTKERAFQVGKEIAAAVTADNPTPVKLRFEKVYLPCVLQTKKRYVGYAFESEDQKEPAFDAKGIETVRRDGTPATAKILEKMLKILFDSRDVSKVKDYVLKQCSKILDGRTTLQDCIIAKEYRGKQYYRPGAVVPALNIARKLLATDKRAEPRVGERVPYVVVHGAPGTPLYQLTRSPLEVINNPSLRLNGAYYVTKQVLPALDRVMSLLGVDVFLWHRHLPRIMHVAHNLMAESSQNVARKKATISQFFKSKHCLMCRNLSIQTICDECLSTDNCRRQATALSLNFEARALERRRLHTEQICMQCTGARSPSEIRCVSTDCPILYKRHRAADEYAKASTIRKALIDENML